MCFFFFSVKIILFFFLLECLGTFASVAAFILFYPNLLLPRIPFDLFILQIVESHQEQSAAICSMQSNTYCIVLKSEELFWFLQIDTLSAAIL